MTNKKEHVKPKISEFPPESKLDGYKFIYVETKDKRGTMIDPINLAYKVLSGNVSETFEAQETKEDLGGCWVIAFFKYDRKTKKTYFQYDVTAVIDPLPYLLNMFEDGLHGFVMKKTEKFMNLWEQKGTIGVYDMMRGL